jgi:hypothetical protein
MSLSDLASIGSLVSGIAVLISLIYLSLQVRQTEKNQKALIQQGRAARIADSVLQFAQGDLIKSFMKGQAGDADISAEDLARFRMIFRAMMISAEDSHFHHAQNLLDENAYASLVASMRFMLGAPGFRAMGGDGWHV